MKAKDSASTPNETTFSTSVVVYTLANTPGVSSSSDITKTSIRANWSTNGNRLGTEYWCENASNGTNSGWTTNTYWDCTGLTCENTYSFIVKAKNGAGVETGFTSLGSQSTPACSGDTTPPTPDPMTWTTVPYSTGISSGQMLATTATDSSGVEYFFDETSGNDGGSDSGWQDSSEYTDEGLQAGATYIYQVRARDKSPNQNTTAWSSLEQVTISPIAPVISPISDDSIIEGDVYTGPTPILSSGTFPLTWSLVSFPSGMTIDENIGVLSWPIPTLTGSPHLVTIRATNDAGSDDESWSLTVIVKPSTIALINPDNDRILKFGFGNWSAENNNPPCDGSYYSAACGTIGDQCGGFIDPSCWSGVGQQPDFIADVLRDNGYTVDEFSADSFPDSSAADYDVVIVQDPMTDNIREFSRSVETNLPDLLESVANELFVTKLRNYFNTGGKLVLVGDAVKLLEVSTAQKPTLNFGKTVLTDQVANSSSHDCAPDIWPFVRGNPFCCIDRSGNYSYQISSTLLSLDGTDISDLTLFNGNDLGPAQIWSDTIYYPEDGVSLLDIQVTGSGDFVTRGDTCSPPVYTATVDDILSHFMGYTTYNGKKIYYIGSDSFWDYQVKNNNGAWHCPGDDWAEIKNQITETGKDAIVKLIQVAIQGGDINPLPGDMDGNGNPNLADAILALQIAAGMDPSQNIYKSADVNGDGKIGIEEAVYVLEKVVGLCP